MRASDSLLDLSQVFLTSVLSLTHAHTRIDGWLGSVTGCKQSPFSSFISLFHTLPPSVLRRHPEVLRVCDRGPWGPKACRTVTTDHWQPVSKAPTHSKTHHTFPPPLPFFTSFLSSNIDFVSSFYFLLSVIQTADSGNLLESWLSQSALSSYLSPELAAYTGELNGSDRPWGGLGGWVLRWMCWSPAGRLAPWRIAGSDMWIRLGVKFHNCLKQGLKTKLAGSLKQM